MEREDQSSPAGNPNSGHDLCLKHKILEGIDPDNVRIKGDSCRILLDNDWAGMLGSLPALDDTLIITGNAAAILGTTRVYPALSFCCAGARASSHDGTFDMELVPWETASFVTHSCQGMASYFLEFSDCTGLVIHRVCLTGHTHRENFIDWVQTHQASGREGGVFTPFPANRWKTVQQRHWFEYEDLTPLPTETLIRTLQQAMKEDQLINAVVGNEGAVQSGEFVPRQIHDLGRWTFASDDTIGLHLDAHALEDVIIHRTPVGESDWLLSLKCFDESGALRLALTAPPGMTDLSEWNGFLQRATKS